MRLALLILAQFTLLAGSLFGQVDVKTTSGFSIVGLTNSQAVGDLLVSSTAPSAVVPIGILDVTTDAANVAVTATNGRRDIVELKQLGAKQWLWTEGGKIDFLVEVVDFDKRIWSKKTFSASIPDVPTPTPPKPPEPVPPGPNPPEPIPPKPDDEKISGLSVLFIYESSQLPAYRAQTLNVLNSTDLRKWFNSNLERDSPAGQVNFRCLDKDTKFPATFDQVYCKWLGQPPPPKLPWIIIGNKDKIVFQGPLPEDAETVKALVLKHKK